MKFKMRNTQKNSGAPSEFDKKEWIRDFKQLKKDYNTEDRERYRPLLNVKHDLKEFFEETEKEEKKSDANVRKEFAGLYNIIIKQK